MYAQLGSTIFDGYKSFVSFSQEEEAVIVQHALIGRKPRLEGAGLGLRILDLTLFLHQEFCKVDHEISKLRDSKDSFEILPLLWGNGKVEGKFVIRQMDTEKALQDPLGNTFAANVHIVLLECIIDNIQDQEQQNAQKEAFAVGNKKPATKSKRVNPESCPKRFSDTISRIRGYGEGVNAAISRSYRAGAIDLYCENIVTDCISIIVGTDTEGSCIFNNDSIRINANNVKSEAQNLRHDFINFLIDVSVLKAENALLQGGIAALVKVSTPVIQKAIIPS